MLPRVLALGCRNCEFHHLFLSFLLDNISVDEKLRPTSYLLCMKIVWNFFRFQGALPNLPEMVSDEEAQRTARKSALIVARMKDGSFRSGHNSKQSWIKVLLNVELIRKMAKMSISIFLLSGLRCWPTWTTQGLLTRARICLLAPRLMLTLYR